MEELADSNGNIAAEKLKEQMRQTQVHIHSCTKFKLLEMAIKYASKSVLFW